MKEKKNRYLIFGIIGIFALVLGGTLAWYTWTSTNTDVTLTIGGVTVTYSAGEDITGINLRPVSTKEVGVEKNYAIKKDITVSSSKTTYFNLYLNAELFPVGLKDSSLKWELYEGSTLLNSGDFGSTKEGDRIRLLSIEEIGATQRNLSLYIWIDGNMSNPSSMQNQEYRFVLNADATDMSLTPALATDYLTTLYNSGKSTQEVTANNVTYEYKKEVSMMKDIGNNLRYYGADPDNYVMFNNELWRIIGVFNNIDDGTGKTETRVKIARATPLSGTYKWDDTNNDWTNSSLKDYLNGEYLNSITTASLIGNAVWDIRGTTTTYYADEFYNIERTELGSSPKSTTEVAWMGKIALMLSYGQFLINQYNKWNWQL